ncbi:MAG: PEGA domain-containing protein [Myxococcota bacterium]
MISATVFGLVISNPALSLAGPSTYEVDDRQPMALVLSTPTGRQARVRSSEVIRIIDRHLRADTSLRLQPLSEDLVSNCRGRLGCLALKARSDYDRGTLRQSNGSYMPYREHVRRMRRDGIVYPRYLLIVSNVTLAGRPDRMSAVMVDTDLALQVFHEAKRESPDWEDKFEARVDASALAGQSVTMEIERAGDVNALFGRFLGQNVRQRLQRSGHWRPYGSLRIETPVPHAAIIWDGRTIGSTAVSGETRLEQALVGSHSVTIQHPDYEPMSVNVEIESDQTEVLQVDLRLKPERRPLGRQILLWTGAGLFAVGGSLGIYALARQNSDATSVCFGADCSAGRSFQTFGYNPNVGATENINPSGVLTAPLGYSLAITGATWSLGTLLTDEDDFPWLPLVIGIAAGS